MRDIATAEPDEDFTVEILMDLPGVVLLVRIDWADGAQEYQFVVAQDAPATLTSAAESMIPHGFNWVRVDPIGDAVISGRPATMYTHYNHRDWNRNE